MKVTNILFSILFAAVLVITSCQDEHELGAKLDPSELQYSVTQESGYDNKVFLMNQTNGVLPLWEYGVGVSHKEVDTVLIPFAGNYWVKFTGFGRAGAVSDSTEVSVTENDPEYFSAPEWAMLANGTAGKTWVFDPIAPIGYYGKDYIAHTGSGDDWSYFPEDCPSWSGFGCGTVWGEMTFDLSGNFNYTVKQTSLTSSDQTTSQGTFAYDIAGKTLKFNGARMLYSANYSSVVNWNEAYVFSLTEDVLYLGVTANDGSGLRFKYIPKS